MKIFDYSSLSSQKEQLIQAFHDKGIIGLRGVPGFEKAQEEFIGSARKFISLSPEIRDRCSPSNSYERGWSYGSETYKDVTDSFKGSYYAAYPDEPDTPNLWPSQDLPDFKSHYLNLVNIIFQTGKEVESLIDIHIKDQRSNARMLYYGPIHDRGEVEWCSEHRDHSILTGLCPGAIFLDGQPVSKPPGTGLFVRGEEISSPQDVLLFQIGEVAELITNGAVTATEHKVCKAVGGYERFNMAVFIRPQADYVIESTLTKYNDRFRSGMTYQEWDEKTYAKYYENVTPLTVVK